MPSITIQIRPPDLVQRMHRYPEKLQGEMEKTMRQSLAHMQGSVPDYPPAPANSSYRRTGTLGRTIGAGGGRADIYSVERVGSGYEATLGTRLEYAPYVIGERQAWMRAGRWWKLSSVLSRATPGIERLFEAMAERLAAHLNG